MKIQYTLAPPGSEEEGIQFLNNDCARGIQPFVGEDTSVGMEYELQVAVEGRHDNVDLPLTISGSSFFKNTVKRTERGDLSPGCIASLEEFLHLHDDTTTVWENSWVRFPETMLSEWTRKILDRDMLADKSDPEGARRSDIKRFRCLHRGEEWLRLPVSYLLKLALADVISSDSALPRELFTVGRKLLDNLLSDNTSPEILSFSIPVASENKGIGELAAAETARTLLIIQLLVQYANRAFGLLDSGQKCLIYFAPHAPVRQKKLNEIVPDGFYRHLFMSPCLSGWDRGEEKHHYMGLCHKTLSRSGLNTISKLKDAGIITNNLIVLPNTSNTCLANNGIHVSLGSRVLTAMAKDRASHFTPTVEKYFGDLVIKIVEHFLPLFVGIHSAAPYRIDFPSFHPENVLGFLPHELDYTHLRMIWRRWKKKAQLTFMGRTITPFGPRKFDTILATLLGLRGDLLPDYRLTDYLVSLLSTESSPALNGVPGNHEQLKEELMEMGVFDSRMSIYLLYRQRACATAGYSGFEGRSYSLFHSLGEEMAEAVDLQNLITALAYKYVLEERICHQDIPDHPSVESERRQIFFGSAIGIPTFFVHSGTGNRLLRRILTHIPSLRNSNRYKGYIRVENDAYRIALLQIIRADGAELIEKMNLTERLDSLQSRLEGGKPSAFTKIISDVQGTLPGGRHPLRVPADTFNSRIEEYYRTDLKRHHLREGISVVADDCRKLEGNDDACLKEVIATLPEEKPADRFLMQNQENLIDETADVATLRRAIFICLAAVRRQQQQSSPQL